MTDSFDIRVSPPRDGCLQTEIQLGSAPAVTLTPAAAQDELTELRIWMEDIARGVSPALVCFADAVFWQGTNIGDYNYLHIDDTYIDLSDISSLEKWYDDFYLLTSEDDMHTKPPFAIIGEEARQEWHVRGLKIAESLRSRIPQHYVFVYMQSWPLADLTPYFAADCGRIIFDERFIEEEA